MLGSLIVKLTPEPFLHSEGQGEQDVAYSNPVAVMDSLGNLFSLNFSIRFDFTMETIVTSNYSSN